MSKTKVNNWYFGDYWGSYQGSSYNNLIYAVTITFFFTVAIDTEIALINENRIN